MFETPLVPWRLGYVEIDVQDLEAATKWWTSFGMLEVSEQDAERVHLRGGTDHHWLVLHKAEQAGVRRMAYELGEVADLERFRTQLREHGVDFTEHPGEWTGPALRFTDPDGYELELFAHMGNTGHLPIHPYINPAEFLHVVIGVSDLEKSFSFYGDVLGFRESDRVLGRTIFLRGGIGFHHSVVLGGGRAKPPFLDHICLHFNDIDDLMRVRQNFIEQGQPLDRDLLRHPTSGSVSFYVKTPEALSSPNTVEFCMMHAKIEDPDHRPRTMAPGRWSTNVWMPPTDLHQAN